MKNSRTNHSGWSDARNTFACAALVGLAFAAVNPFCDMAFDDDWSYAFTVKHFLDTGRITYHGWSTAAIITQMLWGALFAKLFGFSFTTLRFSTLPLAMGCGAISYLLARKAALSPASSILAALTLGLSPLFLPLATSFMTDVPGLFFILLVLYSTIAAAQSPCKYRWLFVAVAAGILGGMSRQLVWVVPMALIPALAYYRRSDRRFVLACVVGWALTVADAAATVAWFGRQPDVVLEPPMTRVIRDAFSAGGSIAYSVLTIFLTLTLLTLPAAMPFYIDAARRIWRERRGRPGLCAMVVIFAGVGLLIAMPEISVAPWLSNVLTPIGSLGDLELFGNRPSVEPDIVRTMVGSVTIVASSLMLTMVVHWLSRPATVAVQIRRFFNPKEGEIALPAIAVCATAILLALVPRMVQKLTFDRYLLEFIPLLSIVLLRGVRWPGIAAYVVLAVFTIFALAQTQDVLALGRARAAAASRLEAAGVKRTAIADGFEFDSWTQLQVVGWINRQGISNSTHTYDPNASHTPVLCCEYRVEYNPRSGETDPSPLGVIDYISWLPPFHRRLYIDRFRNAWWLTDPHPKYSRPPSFWEGYEHL